MTCDKAKEPPDTFFAIREATTNNGAANNTFGSNQRTTSNTTQKPETR